MSAPEYVPVKPAAKPRSYESPHYVPGPWMPDRPADLESRQPQGARFGAQGPDQGYALLLADRFRDRLRLADGEDVVDALQGALGIALRRASMFGRAPVIHDLELAFSIWGYFDASPSDELLAERKRMFAGLSNIAHHYEDARALADLVPDATLRMTPAAVARGYDEGHWRELVGL